MTRLHPITTVLVFLIAFVVKPTLAGDDAKAERDPGSQPLRVINIQSDSEPGWRPTRDDERQALDAAGAFLAALDAGDVIRAHSMMTEPLQQSEPLMRYASSKASLARINGPLVRRNIIRVTWAKNPKSASEPGTYASVDIADRFEKADRSCGYLVLVWNAPKSRFEIMREQTTTMDNASAKSLAEQQGKAALDAVWARMSATCPNYKLGTDPRTNP